MSSSPTEDPAAEAAGPQPATDATTRHNLEVAALAFLSEDHDRERAVRGRIAPPSSPQVTHEAGWSVWDLEQYDFLDGTPAPPEVNPSLWRQAQLNTIAGLFEVAPGFHQVRGLDLANLTVVDGEQGRIVIDPLTSAETARAAMALVDEHLGPRPVTAVIYSHSHVDHFGGVLGVVDVDEVNSGRVPIIAPAGFVDAAVRENVVAGTVMTRRGSYMYGPLLPKGPTGQVDAGIGKGVPLLATTTLVAPTVSIHETGTEMIIDGVRIVFQMVPDTEAPAEMNFHFPDHRVLCVPELCVCTLHNLYTPRGTVVRDGLAWSKALQEVIDLFGADTDTYLASHNWPRWGRDDIVGHMGRQRDIYRFIHDQTLRLANLGHTPIEIAEMVELPAELSNDPSLRSYYGTVSHNVKAVYQRYLGWFDGNPANLHPHPPAEAGARYVDFMGGARAVLDRARTSFDEGDYRWVAEVVGHVVFSDPANQEARNLQAAAFEQLGYQAESAPWRNFYLTGAQELRHGPPPGASPVRTDTSMIEGMTFELVLDALGVRLNPERAAGHRLKLQFEVTDRAERWLVAVENSALHARLLPSGEAEVSGAEAPAVDLPGPDLAGTALPDPAGGSFQRPTTTVSGPHGALAALALGQASADELEGRGELTVEGDPTPLDALLDSLDSFPLMFPIVTP